MPIFLIATAVLIVAMCLVFIGTAIVAGSKASSSRPQPLFQQETAPSLMQIGGSLVLSKLQADSDLKILDNGRTVVSSFDEDTENNSCTISKKKCPANFLDRHRNELSLTEAPFVADEVSFKIKVDEYDHGDENDRATSVLTQIIGTGVPALKVGVKLSGKGGGKPREVLSVNATELDDFNPRKEVDVKYKFDKNARKGSVTVAQEGKTHTENFKFKNGEDLKIGTYSGTSKARKLKSRYTDINVTKSSSTKIDAKSEKPSSSKTKKCSAYKCSGKYKTKPGVSGDSCCAGGKADCGSATPCYKVCCDTA